MHILGSRKLITLLLILFCTSGSLWAAPTPKATTAVLVDKKTNMIYVTEYKDGRYQTVKSYHTTLGKVKGDKEVEGDLKTPEGIYIFNNRLTSPKLPKKFGELAFHVNYPNTYDQMAGRTGNSIMLHATDEPNRLKQNYDSEGCVVVRNEEIREIEPSIRMNLTPILIFSELTPDYWAPGQNTALKTFFGDWIQSWESKDIDKYMTAYHDDFVAPAGSAKKMMTKPEWKAYKSQLNHQYASIQIGPEDVKFYSHPKYSMITFTQNYQSKLRGGSWGHRSRGTKILYIAEEAGKPKIIAETYTNQMW